MFGCRLMLSDNQILDAIRDLDPSYQHDELVDGLLASEKFRQDMFGEPAKRDHRLVAVQWWIIAGLLAALAVVVAVTVGKDM